MNRIAGVAALFSVGGVLVLSAADVRQTPAQQPIRTALILGQVLDGASDRPMGGVVVSLNGPTPSASAPLVFQPPTGQPARVVADATGRFVFTQLSAGRYTFSISTASGPLIGGYGMRRPGGATQSFELAEGQRIGDVTVRAWKHGAVAGTVIDQDGEPIVETRVTLLRVENVAGHRAYRAGPTTMTDDRGMYRIAKVEPGEYTVYLPYMQMTVPVDVQAAYDTASSKGQAARQEFERTYGLESSGINGSGVRIGDHLLVRSSNTYGGTGQLGPSFVTPPPDANGRAVVYPMTFYPGVTSLSEAATFAVEAGQDRASTDMQVRLVAGIHISGRVMGIAGPAPMATVRLVAQSAAETDNEAGFETAKTVTNEKGDFTMLGVPPGSYILRVARVPNTTRPVTMMSVNVGDMTTFSAVDQSNLPPLPVPDTPTESRSMPVAVGDQDIRNLTVQLQEGPRVSGRVAYDGNSKRLTEDQLVRVTVTLDPVDGRVFPGATGKGLFDASGQFRTLGLLPGRYMVRLGGSMGPWLLGTVSVGGQTLPDPVLNITNREISDVVVTLTDRVASIGGSVRSAAGGPDANAAVIVFPASRELWLDTTADPRRLKSVRASTSGAWEIYGLPAGDYVVVAIDDRFSAEWSRPQRLESLSRFGTRITIGPAEKKSLDLTTQVVR